MANEPTPYVPEEGWDFYRLGDVPDDWRVKSPEDILDVSALIARRQEWSGIVLARPPEPKLIAVMLTEDDVEEWITAYGGKTGVWGGSGRNELRTNSGVNGRAFRMWEACREALAVEGYKEDQEPPPVGGTFRHNSLVEDPPSAPGDYEADWYRKGWEAAMFQENTPQEPT